MADGEIECIAVDTPVPSVFSHEILNANPYAYLDDAPLEERRARAVEMRRVLPEAVLNEVGALDPAAIEQVRADAWPDVRDADEMADVLHTFIALPEDFLTSTTEHRRIGRSGDLEIGSSGHPRHAGTGRVIGSNWEGFLEQLKESRRASKVFVSDDARVAQPPGPPTRSGVARDGVEVPPTVSENDNPYRAQPRAAVPHNSVGFWVSAEKAKTFRAV